MGSPDFRMLQGEGYLMDGNVGNVALNTWRTKLVFPGGNSPRATRAGALLLDISCEQARLHYPGTAPGDQL